MPAQSVICRNCCRGVLVVELALTRAAARTLLSCVDFKIKTVELNGKEVKLQIWDTYGGERFRTITTSYFRGTAGIIMVYDMTDEKSFEHISSNWLHNVQENTSEDVQKVLLANKCDLDDQQMVSKEKGESFAQENGMRFFETSAKTNINVDTAVLTLVEDIIEKNPTAGLSRKTVDPAKNSNKEKSKCCC
ncbi:ras-related protein Rab-10-like isoform X2 [Anneissia japonica]|uniref:ras-related protein Rab-10-like isoform X2 n=1 Tax=Anneissia japonica TaxID=1529436 RepID=UPI001425646C|nr:ras-related protein Rab-10-like isoform X2 [Anneissia japonica]